MQALASALVGAVLGWLFGLLGLVNPLVAGALLALWGGLIGAMLGGIGGAIAHALTGGRRDFTSTIAFRANSYEVLVDGTHAQQTLQLLTSPAHPSAADHAWRPRPSARWPRPERSAPVRR